MKKRLHLLHRTIAQNHQSRSNGYVKGRYIGENITLIPDVMFLTKSFNMPGIAFFVLFLIFEKLLTK